MINTIPAQTTLLLTLATQMFDKAIPHTVDGRVYTHDGGSIFCLSWRDADVILTCTWGLDYGKQAVVATFPEVVS